MLYSLNQNYPTSKPHRVRLEDGTTLTSEEVTNQVLSNLGYVQVSAKPDETSTHTYEWIAGEWQAVEKIWAIRVENNLVLEIKLYTGQDLGTNWVRVSATHFNTYQFPAPGYTYDPQTHFFISPEPFSSWTLSAHGFWKAPVAMPTDGKRYEWKEDSQTWAEIYDGNS